MKSITIYRQDGCPACEQVIPIIKKMARVKHVPVKVVDVDKCGKPCSWVKYVPTVKVDGKQIKDLSKLARMLE